MHKTLLVSGVALASATLAYLYLTQDGETEEERTRKAALKQQASALLIQAKDFEMLSMPSKVVEICKQIVNDVDKNCFAAYLLLIKCEPTNKDWIRRALCCASNAEEKQIIGLLDSKTREEFERNIVTSCTYPESHLLRALHFNQIKDYTKARFYCDQVIVHHTATNYDIANAYYLKSTTYAYTTESSARIACLDLAISKCDNHVQAMYKRAETRLGKHVDLHLALADINQALSCNPYFTPARFLLANYHLQNNNAQEAEKELLTCIGHGSQNMFIYDTLADIYCESNRLEDAIKILQDAIIAKVANPFVICLRQAMYYIYYGKFGKAKGIAMQVYKSTHQQQQLAHQNAQAHFILQFIEHVMRIFTTFPELNDLVKSPLPVNRQVLLSNDLFKYQLPATDHLIEWSVWICSAGTKSQYVMFEKAKRIRQLAEQATSTMALFQNAKLANEFVLQYVMDS